MVDNGHADAKVSAQQKPAGRGGWSAAILILFVELAERFAFFGLSANLITYLTNELHEPIPTAAKNVNTWIGVACILPVFGALIADSFLGRFNTIILASIIYFMGMVLLMLSVSLIPLHRRKPVFFVALYILTVGEGGHKPCVQTFAADQFEEDSQEDKKTKSSFFNWWYSGIMVGSCSAMLVVIYVQENVSWVMGFGMLAIALAVSLAIFLLGIKRYKKQGPLGSPFTTVARVLVAAARKRQAKEMRDNCGVYYGDESDTSDVAAGQPKARRLARTAQFRYLDKAMIIDSIDAGRSIRDPWRLCSLNEVEEVKLILRLIPIWLSCLVFAINLSPTGTYFTKQGSTMIRSIGPHFNISPASLQGLVFLTSLISTPIYDRIFVRLARKFTGHPSGITTLQRIGIGLFMSPLVMVISALVEAKRIGVAKDHKLMDNPKAIVPMKVWWLLPQYILTGLSDLFIIVGLQQLLYDQMPDAMRSLGAALCIGAIGVGFFISSAMISVVQEISSRCGEEWLGDNLNGAHLDYYYWLLAGLSALSFCVYVWIAKSFEYKNVQRDDVPAEEELTSINGHQDGEA
ncbi:Protein NRT1/ PTR FAMILY 5.4 [Morella rubra]|uniref:Protein NRT1/ PTR FAMILY 5.4 n=1 Tax=Morella rubra TaxID=262757 RepID=A0A6A1ULY1_9ROSI|nr:Protein NRT1/ PTR FAMILY 5.4 [Morella rubra]KAB1201220.1 Protein NRT1/ PTR FAMILY 5.4 [Morella rubra]